MPISTRKKAKHLVLRSSAHGINRQRAKQLQLISSIGTERNYIQAASNYLGWCEFNNIASDLIANNRILKSYLDERSEWVKQKTLDLERQALQLLYKQKLPYVQAQQPTILAKRSYTVSQVNEIAEHQSEKNSITTLLALHSGVRAHEAATLLRREERSPSQHRVWDTLRFLGFPEHKRYTVIGKGGLCREIAVPVWLSEKLEARRSNPVRVTDRGIFYSSSYDVGFGQSWSQSFSSASKRSHGFSRGGHGLRHSYAKFRLHQLQKEFELLSGLGERSYGVNDAFKILSQELGHFRIDVTFCYLR